MFDHPTRREFSALAFTLLAAGPRMAFAEDEPKAGEKPAAGSLPSPDPIPERMPLPELPTIPVRRGSPSYNVQMVDASLLPRDLQTIWVLNFAFKPLRITTVEVGGKRRLVHYLYYRVANRTGKPREFVPQFTMVTDTGKRYEESVIPQAIPIIQAREDRSIPLLGAVEIVGVVPPSAKPDFDDSVFGVATWEGIDPNADRLQIYVRGLSDGYQQIPDPNGGKPTVKYKTLRIDLIRRGDARDLNEKEISLAEPPYEWVYW